MPLPKPNEGENQDDFIARCMGNDNMQEYDQKQRLAICFSQWKNKEKQEAIMDNESRRALPQHKTDTSTSPWDGSENEAKLKLDQDMAGHLRDADVEPAPLRSVTDNKVEWRALNLESLEVRAEEGKPVIITGVAAPFGKLSEPIMDSFLEKIDSKAFDETLDSDIRCLFNHDPNYVLGRTTAGTLRLEKHRDGLRFENDPPDTQWARDLQVSIKRGDVTQMSFAFECLDDSWDKSGEIPVRTLKKVKLQDISIVTYPAYPQTKVGIRALTEDELIIVLDKYFQPKAEPISQAPQVLTEGFDQLGYADGRTNTLFPRR